MTYLLNNNIDLKLNNFLDFIHNYLDDSFNNSVKILDIVIHIKNKQRLEEMKQLLLLEDIGVLIINNLKLEENHNDLNGEFKKYFEKYRLYEKNDILHHIINSSSKTEIIGVEEMQKIEKESKNKPLIKMDSFSSLAIYRNWSEFNKKIPRFTIFTAKIKVVPMFFYITLFGLIYREEKDFRFKDVKELYNNILSETNGKINYEGEIKIFYNFKDYLDNKSSVYPILYELQEKGILGIGKVELKKWYLHFTLKNLNNISLNKFEEAYNFTKRRVVDNAFFKKENLYINGEEIDFRNKEISKTFNLIKLFFQLQKIKKSREILFVELESIYNRKRYKWLGKSKFKYEDLRKIIEDFNSRINKKYNIKTFMGVNKSGIECQYIKL